MQNSSVAVYQTLLPGVSNVTLRMRYYGLYAWLRCIYGKRFIRRAEALYALIAYRHGGERGHRREGNQVLQRSSQPVH